MAGLCIWLRVSGPPLADFLEAMAEGSRARLERAGQMLSLPEIRSRAEKVEVKPLRKSAFHLFAELKPVSPTEGPLGDFDPVVLALSYSSGGATAISVLTEPTRFGGSLGLMQTVAKTVETPVMRKDFLVDPYQVWEARAFGADGVLLVARLFDHETLAALVEATEDAGLFALIEVFEESDITLFDASWESKPNVLVGVNCRDLETLEVRPESHERLVGLLPSGTSRIAESGIGSADRVVELREMGYDGVLVGTSLMKSDDPSGLLARMAAGAST